MTTTTLCKLIFLRLFSFPSVLTLHSLALSPSYAPADSLSRTLFGIAQFAQNRSACSHCLEKIPPKCNSEFQWLWKLTPPPRRPPTPHKVCRCLNEPNVYIHSLYLICGINIYSIVVIQQHVNPKNLDAICISIFRSDYTLKVCLKLYRSLIQS